MIRIHMVVSLRPMYTSGSASAMEEKKEGAEDMSRSDGSAGWATGEVEMIALGHQFSASISNCIDSGEGGV